MARLVIRGAGGRFQRQEPIVRTWGVRTNKGSTFLPHGLESGLGKAEVRGFIAAMKERYPSASHWQDTPAPIDYDEEGISLEYYD